jgi:hypothetical protein
MIATKYLTEYIKSVCKNSLNNHNLSNQLTIDLVVSGGVLNYSYGFGTILYLKELQSQNKIHINKVSGTSSGSVLAMLALCDNTTDIDELYTQLKDHFRENGNLSILKHVIESIVYKCIKNDTHAKSLSDKLFISTTDMKKSTQKVICNYTTRNDIVEAIFSSCFIPFITDGHSRYNSIYIDGVAPYIFKNNTTKTIYINLVNTSIIRNMFVTNGEVNPQYRVIEGVVETAKFFNEGRSCMCSWINDWTLLDFISQRFFYLCMIIMATIVETIYNLNIPISVKNNFMYKSIFNCSCNIVNDYVFLSFI